MKQNEITRSAKGKACTFRSDVCDSGVNNENVVFCHELYDTLDHPYYKPHFIKEMAQFAITRTKRQLVRSLLVDEYYPDDSLDGYDR